MINIVNLGAGVPLPGAPAILNRVQPHYFSRGEKYNEIDFSKITLRWSGRTEFG